MCEQYKIVCNLKCNFREEEKILMEIFYSKKKLSIWLLISFCTFPLVVFLKGTFDDSIYDMCVVFFTILIICKLQGTKLERGFKWRIQIEVKCLDNGKAQGKGEGNGLPQAGQGLWQ